MNIWPKDKTSCIVNRMYFFFSTFRVLTNVNMSSVLVTHDSREVSVSNEEKKLSIAKAKQGNRGQPKTTDHHLQFFE